LIVDCCFLFSGLFEGVAVVGSYSGNVIAISLPEVQDQIKTSVKGVDEKTSVKGVNDKNCCLWCITLPDAVEAEATFTKNSTFVFVGSFIFFIQLTFTYSYFYVWLLLHVKCMCY